MKTPVREKQSWGGRGGNEKVKAPLTTGRWIRMSVSRDLKMESRKSRFNHSSAGTEEARMASEAVGGLS